MRFALPLTVAALAALTTPALAQSYEGRTWGQPYYGAYSQPSPLSEAEPEAHARLGAAGNGYTYGGGPVVYGGYGYGYGPRRGYGRANGAYGGGYAYGRGYAYGGYGYGVSRSHQYDPPRAGYRDVWGYNDDRPPSALRGRTTYHVREHYGRNCDCPDVYLYDR